MLRPKVWHNDHNLIFTSTVGTPIDPEWFGRNLSKHTKEAGLGRWPIHELRHPCESLFMAMEVPLEAISDQLSRALIRLTADAYGHLMVGSKNRAAAAMREVLFPSDLDRASPTVNLPVGQLGGPRKSVA